MIYGYSRFGYEGAIVEVEAEIRKGIPAVDIVGLADGSVKESREIVRAAITNQGFEFPMERVLIGLLPADTRKEGRDIDLAIALAILCAQYNIKIEDSVLCIGGLSLAGHTERVHGQQAALQTASAAGIKYAIVPGDDKVETSDGITVFYVRNLSDAYHTLNHLSAIAESAATNDIDYTLRFQDVDEEIPFDDMNTPRQNAVKFALTVAMAGRHNMMSIRHPGDGTTALMECARWLSPTMSVTKHKQTERIWSLGGYEGHDVFPPFRMPYQMATIEGMYGGGINCMPGEISLACNGTLFLDDAQEFRSSVLQMLRVPVESHFITLARAGRSTVYPADFQLLMTANACPCGNFGHKDKPCLCSRNNIETYWRKFSAPLLDRIEIVTNPDMEYVPDITLDDARQAILNARKAQRKRGKYNSRLSVDEIMFYGAEISENWKLGFSYRQYRNALRVARTIADIAGRGTVVDVDMEQAVQWTLKTSDKYII